MLTLQNGLGNVEKIEKYVPLERIIVGVTDFPCELLGPGQVRNKGIGHTKILSADSKITPRLEEIQQALAQAGLNGEISHDLFGAVWEKVAFNAAMNGLGAVAKLTVGNLGASPDGRNLAVTLAKEVVAVAIKKGIPAKENVVLEMMDNAFEHHTHHMTSMLQDVLACRPTEVEAIHGAVVREAAKLNMAVPTTEVIYKLIRVLEQSYGKDAVSSEGGA